MMKAEDEKSEATTATNQSAVVSVSAAPSTAAKTRHSTSRCSQSPKKPSKPKKKKKRNNGSSKSNTSKTSSQKKKKTTHSKAKSHPPPQATPPKPQSKNVKEKEKGASKCCVALTFSIQLLIFSCALVALGFSYFCDMSSDIIKAYAIVATYQFVLLTTTFFGICMTCCSWLSLINCIMVLLCEFGVALYITATDMYEECHEVGCSFLKGQLLHRIIFVGICLIFGAIHSIMAAGQCIALCMSSKKDEQLEVHQSNLHQEQQPPVRKRRPRSQSVSTSRASRSRCRRSSSRASSSRGSQKSYGKRAPADTPRAGQSLSSSWYNIPLNDGPAPSLPSYPSSSQNFSSSAASECPYSAAILAHSQYHQERNQYMPSTPNPFQQSRALVPAVSNHSVTVTFPSSTISVGAPEAIVVRIPQYDGHGNLPQYPSYYAESHRPIRPAQASAYQSSHQSFSNVPRMSSQHQQNASVKTAKNINDTDKSDASSSFFTLSQTSDPASFVLPTSFASQNGAQGIFAANSPSKYYYKK